MFSVNGSIFVIGMVVRHFRIEDLVSLNVCFLLSFLVNNYNRLWQFETGVFQSEVQNHLLNRHFRCVAPIHSCSTDNKGNH